MPLHYRVRKGDQIIYTNIPGDKASEAKNAAADAADDDVVAMLAKAIAKVRADKLSNHTLN